MSSVRIGVIGVGNMGASHAKELLAGHIQGATLGAVCDGMTSKREWAREALPTVPVFETSEAMLQSGLVDAVIVATPHYDHPEQALRALEAGKHVLVEKPAGVFTAKVREVNEAAAQSNLVFSMMYNQRTNPVYLKLRDMIAAGELGEIRRTNWIITDWYRSQAYYDSASWRATWAGEGGGVLINQCPHQLDLWQWTIGMMPVRMRAFCGFGSRRNIETEDQVTAYVEYPNGGTGVFITTTGEAAGTNRFEVSGDKGKVVIENDTLTFWRLEESESAFNLRNAEPFGQPAYTKLEVPIEGKNPQHVGIIQNFADAINHGTPLVAPGDEGINGLLISNAMHLSTWLNDWVELPFDESQYEAELRKRAASSSFKPGEPEQASAPVDLKGTH
ncbi:oxidoreductase domain protein [Paenibacillus curdlanolyticus YK9]|uniref:Oxidoreductase domain protein n=1 Tax=Paenibacillus curdlanolyticus YK9 TaxID=717606 RepID=E0IFM9_9BACL|nr:Gfo/Idh/MocA family oxidoreductase [Paenibacillus curdlanolyticus]EFM08695.1 oxidoreductase domain protein [Paenibacillus curdlanolyticus YK9]